MHGYTNYIYAALFTYTFIFVVFVLMSLRQCVLRKMESRKNLQVIVNLQDPMTTFSF